MNFHSIPITQTICKPYSTSVSQTSSVPAPFLSQDQAADLVKRLSQLQQGCQPCVATCPDENISVVDEMVNFMIGQTNRQTTFKQIDETQRKSDKCLRLLLTALQTGHIDLAMLLFSSLESREATEMTKVLTQKLVEAQENRRKLTGQMASNDKDSQKNLAQTQASVQEVNDTIQMLTTFIRDVNDQKNRTMEFANNFLSNENQTTMSIVRGMKG
jgi:hypothetical protein